MLRTILNNLYVWLMRGRLRKIAAYADRAGEIQRAELFRLLKRAANTEYGKKFGFGKIRTEKEYREKVPVITYEDLQPYVERLMQGEDGLLWPDKIRYFSKSSGTTASKSKFIPVSREALHNCHYTGGKDFLALYLKKYRKSGLLVGKNVSLGGSLHSYGMADGRVCGDVSALITKDLPVWANFYRTPSKKIALTENWNEKLEGMVKTTLKQDIRAFLGVPSWMMLYMQKALEVSGKKSLREVWPDMELFVYGGVSLSPYRSQFDALTGKDFRYMETYNASEGFFGIQDDLSQPDMLLMLDYGIYYEFVPMEEAEKPDMHAVGIEDVEIGRNYAMVITTNAGLWRYMIGDTVVFSSKKPYRFHLSGRTRHFINTFGEEVIEDNANKALDASCRETGAEISEYTAAPVFLDNHNHACHQWLIEFKREPDNMEAFTLALDRNLKAVNSDYEAKRTDNLLLKLPKVVSLPKGTFLKWLERKGKLGGQYKVPRLSNHRGIVEELLAVNACRQ